MPLNPNLPAPLPGAGTQPDPVLNPPNGPVPGGYWQGGKFYPDSPTTTTYPPVTYETPTRRLQYTQSPRAYTPTPEETAEIEQQARAELDAQIAAAPWHRRDRMQGNYQGTLNGIISRLTQALVSNPPGDTIGVPPGEDPVVEPDGTEPPPTEPPPIGPPPTEPPPTNGILSDVSNIPALEALRGDPTQSIFDFGENYFSRPEQGIERLPSPFQFGKPFLTMPGSQRQDVLDFYKSQFALKPEDTMNMFFASQPGFRRFGGGARGF
ncbi:hypothetical protein LCGC14_2517520 [marine sediment metagenome]|uniref:Uncharacterized protein n=1 Tax=marine sediment metagenome TaxID=412755 RepID=A0A0F9AXC4_9ZZZZ